MADLVITGTTSEGFVVSFTIPEKYLSELVEGEKSLISDFSAEIMTENLQDIVDMLAHQVTGIVCCPGIFTYQTDLMKETLGDFSEAIIALLKAIQNAQAAQQN